MLDAIKFELQNNLSSLQEQNLIERFALYKVEERNNRVFWHNKQNDNLKQNNGVYIKFENDKIFIETSLHKFWNSINGNGLRNDNFFSFKDVNKAFELLENFLQLDINTGKLYYYEYGINIKMNEPPKVYFSDLQSIKQKKQTKEFTWVVYYKKFKVYSTEKHKAIRTVFALYDKTFESLESSFTNVEENLLRAEIKHKRIEKPLFIYDLKSDLQQIEIKSNFKRNFIDNIQFAKFVSGLTKNQIEIFEMINVKGVNETINYFELQTQHKVISQSTFERRKKEINKMINSKIKPIYTEKRTSIEFKEKVMQILRQV